MAQNITKISEGLDALLKDSKQPILKKTTKDKVLEKEPTVKTSLVVTQSDYTKIRQIAFNNNLNISEVVTAALRLAIRTYEAKYGDLEDSKTRITADDLLG